MSNTDFVERIIEVKNEIAQKCAQDSDFREAFISDPNSVIEAEYGLEPGSFSSVVFKPVVENKGELVFVIPPDFTEMELSDDELDQVAGGFAFSIAMTGAVVAGVGIGASTTVGVGAIVQNTRAGRAW
jgi:hypothetical protein